MRIRIFMATGTQMYNAVATAVRRVEPGAEFPIHPVDANDLMKLKPPDLQELGYDLLLAEELSSALFVQNFLPLGRVLRVTFVKSFDAPRLLPD